MNTALFDRTCANLAVFHQGMESFQVLEFTGTRFQTFNVITVKATGFEVETTNSVLDGPARWIDRSRILHPSDVSSVSECAGHFVCIVIGGAESS